ncbi:hypothetical protein BKP37_06990 [Anaerobacillus alkalilacustris]|uniref:Apea-like HEPN domain-containing protein n=1 Tax=Anaerobacillus alkalilacustris TaxID=393763 RepID=A0A1S2LRG9_9BACI|nr:hypothetical protein [Anaerobacillus alkalilacustris]OIJ14924.1 hypothetical protein BKP37_06990 [Anaerobacillus alkalilacustris]
MKEYLTIKEHAWKLCLVLEAIYMAEEDDRWLHIKDWLHMASGVIETKVDTQYFDESTLFCGPARDYETNKSKLWSVFCNEFTIFNFIWGSLESLIENITGAEQTESKPYAGIKYLRENYKTKPIDKYECVYNCLTTTLEDSSYQLNKQYFKYGKFIKPESGLHLVSKIRNSFAHGSISLPDPHDWSKRIKKDILIISVSSRTVLLTMQMLLITHLSKMKIKPNYLYMFDVSDPNNNLNLKTLLSVIHLPDYSNI